MKPDEIVDYAEALAQIAATGGGPKALADHLARVTSSGVLLEDAQWHRLAAAGTSLPPSARGVVEAGAPGHARRVSCGDAHLGWLSLFGASADCELLLRLTAAAIGTELARNGASPRAKQASFWSGLLDGSLADAPRDEALARGIALAARYCVVVLETDAPPGASTSAELRSLAAEAFRGTDAALGSCERGGRYFVFVPAERSIDASNARTAAALLPRTAARRKSALRIFGGIGPVEPVDSLARGAAAAEAALSIGRRIFGEGRVVAYDALGAYPLLYEGADAASWRAFAAAVLAPLRAYDEKHQTELERTLKLYFSVGQNVKTAAERLNVHRHTVFYRLRQIGEIASRSLESPHDQLTLRLAIAVDELHS